jgi:hypothetical protein
VSLGYAANPASSGIGRYALPVLLITGALLALAGSSALAIGRGGATALAWLRRRPGLPARARPAPGQPAPDQPATSPSGATVPAGAEGPAGEDQS